MKVKFYSSYFQGQLFLRRVRREALIVFEHQGNEVNGDGLLHTSEPCVCVCVCCVRLRNVFLHTGQLGSQNLVDAAATFLPHPQ